MLRKGRWERSHWRRLSLTLAHEAAAARAAKPTPTKEIHTGTVAAASGIVSLPSGLSASPWGGHSSPATGVGGLKGGIVQEQDDEKLLGLPLAEHDSRYMKPMMWPSGGWRAMIAVRRCLRADACRLGNGEAGSRHGARFIPKSLHEADEAAFEAQGRLS